MREKIIAGFVVAIISGIIVALISLSIEYGWFHEDDNLSPLTKDPSPVIKKTLSVESNVSGARVLVDGKYVGCTNLNGMAISLGKHDIRIEKEGYEIYEERINVEKRSNVSLYAKLLKSNKSRIVVKTIPANANIRFLNIRKGFSQNMELDPGNYQLEISAEGYITEKIPITMNPGEYKALKIPLESVPVKPVYMPPTSTPSEPVVKEPAPKITNSLGMEFVYIPPGSFMMGSPEDEPGSMRYNENQHRVTLTKGFYMQTTEVTQGQWKSIMGNNPSVFKNCGNDCPVEMVLWDEVQKFIKKLNRKEGTEKYRLPTEAEWEYACRAGTTTAYSWGNSADCSKANYGNDELCDECKGKNPGKTMPVASFAPNAWGLYDMHGNVYEWVADIYSKDIYTAAQTDPIYIGAGSHRVFRGGSYFSGARSCRSAYRYARPVFRSDYLGFRLLRDAP